MCKYVYVAVYAMSDFDQYCMYKDIVYVWNDLRQVYDHV